MKLKFIQSEDERGKVRASIQKTGKLAFSIDAIKKFNLNDYKGIRFAIDEEDVNNEYIYAVLCAELEDHAFKISKGGKYFYASSKKFFDVLSIDYKNYKISYGISTVNYEGKDILRMKKIEYKKKKNQNIEV